MPSGLAGMSIAELSAEIRRRKGGLKTLERRRAKIVVKLSRLDDQIQALGGIVGGRGRGGGRPRNEMSLTETLAQVVKGKSMSVTDAAEAVQKAGYRTNSNNFRTQVNIALIKGPFRRVGRGRYGTK